MKDGKPENVAELFADEDDAAQQPGDKGGSPKDDQKPDEKGEKKPPAPDDAPSVDDLDLPDDLVTDDKAGDQKDDESGDQTPPAEDDAEVQDHPTPKDLAEDAGQAFGKIRFDLKQARLKIKELEARAPEPGEEQKQLIEQYEERLGKLDLTQTRAFQQQYDEPMNRQIDAARNLAEKMGLEKTIVDQALQRPTKDRLTFLSEEASSIAPTLMAMLEGVESLKGQREAAIENWKATQAALGEKSQSQQRQEQEKTLRESITQALGAMQDERNIFFLPSKKNENWTAAGKQLAKTAEGIVRSGDMQSITKAVFDGVSAPKYREMVDKLSKQVKSLKAEIAQRNGSRARVGGGAGDTSDTGKPERGKAMSAEEASAALFADE